MGAFGVKGLEKRFIRCQGRNGASDGPVMGPGVGAAVVDGGGGGGAFEAGGEGGAGAALVSSTG